MIVAVNPLADALENALGFGDLDLAQNRLGVLTAYQAKGLLRKIVQNNFSALGMSFFLGLWVVLFSTLQPPLRADSQWVVGICGVLPALLLLWLLWDIWRYSRQIWGDVQAKGVVSLSGMVEIGTERHYNGQYYQTRYWLLIDETLFTIDQPTFEAFQNFAPYQIYYTPQSRVIVSAETL